MIRRPPVPLVSRARASVFGLILAIATLPLVIPLLPFSQEISPGDISSRTLEAPQDAHYDSAAATNAAREAAAQAVQPVPLPLSTAVRQQQAAKQASLLDQVRSIRQNTTDLQKRLDQLNSVTAAEGLSNAGRTSLFALTDAQFDLLQRRADKALTAILAIPVAKPDPASPNPRADPSARVADYLAQLQQKQQASPSVTADPADTGPDTVVEQTALTETLKLFLVYNDIDNVATAQKKDDARKNVATVTKTYTRGQVIVTEGERINAEAIEALRATGVIRSGFDAWDTAGGAIVMAAFAAALAIFTYLYQPFGDPVNRRMILVGLAVVGSLVVVRLAEPTLTPDTAHHYLTFALPVAAAAIITAAFADLTFAAVVAVITGLIAAYIAATLPQIAGSSFVNSIESLELAAAYIAGGLAGAVAVHRADQLSRFALAALATAVATGAVMAAFWLIGTPRSNMELGWIAIAAISAGFGSAIIGLAAFVLLSMALRVTTRLQLMELAQPEHPLMRRLQEEVPGTYHHSMMVGALAERGAAGIGADALVARVGSYYHDIGKLARPQHYIENMLDGTPSPHDSLEPRESAAIIREHVTTGIEIARKYRLPTLVRDFIPQHHGTRLVTYFYRRAAQNGEKVDPALFRYAGPRPQTKEAAIVMLADSCEAVVRARQGPGNPTVDELVDGVFAERLAEGQLDECDITMRELQVVAASFKSTLRAVYHPRVAYPTPTPEEIAGLAHGDGIPSAGG